MAMCCRAVVGHRQFACSFLLNDIMSIFMHSFLPSYALSIARRSRRRASVPVALFTSYFMSFIMLFIYTHTYTLSCSFCLSTICGNSLFLWLRRCLCCLLCHVSSTPAVWRRVRSSQKAICSSTINDKLAVALIFFRVLSFLFLLRARF